MAPSLPLPVVSRRPSSFSALQSRDRGPGSDRQNMPLRPLAAADSESLEVLPPRWQAPAHPFRFLAPASGSSLLAVGGQAPFLSSESRAGVQGTLVETPATASTQSH